MLTNFLEYVPAQCLNLFTHGQRERAIGCINANYPGLLTSPALAIPSMEHSTIAIHPNPTNGPLYFESFTVSPITITDLAGRTVFRGNATVGQNVLDISALPDGVYVLRLEGMKGARVVKMGR